MSWNVVQQIIRIGLQVVGGALVGDALTDEGKTLWDAAQVGVINVAAFVWWTAKEKGWVK